MIRRYFVTFSDKSFIGLKEIIGPFTALNYFSQLSDAILKYLRNYRTIITVKLGFRTQYSLTRRSPQERLPRASSPSNRGNSLCSASMCKPAILSFLYIISSGSSGSQAHTRGVTNVLSRRESLTDCHDCHRREGPLGRDFLGNRKYTSGPVEHIDEVQSEHPLLCLKK